MNNRYYTLEEYFALEESADHRNEYYQGEIYAMAGGKFNHNVITSTFAGLFYQAFLNKPCVAFVSDMRVQTKPDGLYTYPDVMLVCDKPIFLEGREDTITNPQVIIEVLSDSTRKYDSTDKFEFYKELKALRYYVLVEPDRAYIQCFQRIDQNKWLLETCKGLEDSLKLTELNIELPLAQIYARVNFPTIPAIQPQAN